MNFYLVKFINVANDGMLRSTSYLCDILTPDFNNDLQIVNSGEYTEGLSWNESNVLQYLRLNL